MKYTIYAVLLSVLVACNGLNPVPTPSPSTSQVRQATTIPRPTSTSSVTDPEPTPLSPSPVPTSTPTPSPEWMSYTADLRHLPQADLGGLPIYDLTLTLRDDEQGIWEGEARIRYVNNAERPLSDLLLRLYPNTPGYGGSLEIQRLRVDGVSVQPVLEMEGTAARVPLPHPLAPDRSALVTTEYQLAVPYANRAGYGAFNREGHVMTLGGFYPTLAVYEQGWQSDLVTGIGDPLHAEAAFFTVTVTVPSDVIVVTSGRSVERKSAPQGTEIQRFVGGPIRDFALVLGRGYTSTVGTRDEVQIRVFSHTPEGLAAAPDILQYTQDAVQTYERLFGPYPYTELDMIQSPISASGLEAPGAIQLGPKTLNQGAQWLELVVAHEVAHQWWYGMVGNDQVNAAWLDEGLASYASMLYFREVYGADYADTLLFSYYQQPYYAQSPSYQRTPANLPVTAYTAANYGPVVYIHATNFFHELHQALGEEDFLALLHQFLAEYKYRIADAEDFIALANTYDPAAVTVLYAHWIQGKP
jgi:aminopeptidase N